MRSPLRAWIALSLVVAVTAPAQAFDFIPTRYDDPTPDGCLATDCSLREAVIASNAGVDADRILLSAGVYAIDLVGSSEELAVTGDLDVLNSVEIVGIGAGLTVLDATGLGEPPLNIRKTGGTFALRKLTIRNSDTTGVILRAGTHTVEDCEMRDNGTTNAEPGLLVAIGSTVTVQRSNFVGNSGSGLTALQNTTTVKNSTFSGNGNQEILMNLALAFTCTHCTLYDPADSDAAVTVNDSIATFANSIVAGACEFDGTGDVNSLGGNVESEGHTCGFTQGTDLDDVTSVNLALGALADNGGQTRTHLPGNASVANGNADDSLCPLTDQRGVARETNCESGSVEQTSARVATPIFLDGFQQGNRDAWSPTP